MRLSPQHTKFKLRGFPKVESQTIEAVTTNGGAWCTQSSDEDDADDDADADDAFRAYLEAVPRADLAHDMVDSMVEGRAKKLGPLLETMQRGTSDGGYIAARDLLVNVAVVVVLMALAHSEESGEDDDDQDEEEDGDAVEDAQAGSAAQRDGFGD